VLALGNKLVENTLIGVVKVMWTESFIKNRWS